MASLYKCRSTLLIQVHPSNSANLDILQTFTRNYFILFATGIRTMHFFFLLILPIQRLSATSPLWCIYFRVFQLLCPLGLYSYAFLVFHDLALYLRVSKCTGPKFHLHHQFKESEFLFPSDVVGTNFGPSVFYSTEDARVLRTKC